MDPEPQSTTSASTPSKTQLREQHTTAIQQISELFNVALEGNLQLDALQREVDLWKNSYMQAERGKNRLEQELELRKKSSLQQGDAGQAGGQGFTAVLVDGDGAVVSLDNHRSLRPSFATGTAMADSVRVHTIVR
jgi:hypothetical protein